MRTIPFFLREQKQFPLENIKVNSLYYVLHDFVNLRFCCNNWISGIISVLFSITQDGKLGVG